MVKIKVNISGIYNKRTLDKKDIIFLEDGSSIEKLLNEVSRKYRAGISPKCIEDRKIVCVLNDDIVQVEDLSKKVDKDSELSIMQPIAGG